nr:hypothetical protein BaRGS_024568 [Batillaria attramentaria]
MGGSTLLIRHLPASLTKEEKEDFLQHFGALAVRVNGVRGPLKHTAFAEFPSKDLALKVLNKLHQVEVLGCRLVVELAKDQTAGSLPTPSENTLHDRIQESEKTEKSKGKKEENKPEENAFDNTFLRWGIKYPRRRRLFYLYPPPSPTILANISHALAACPKFYVQVLHLMNKMDLPAPFGPVTAQPPLAPDMATTKPTTDILETTEMEVSSAEESELESDTETQRPGGDAPAKRKRVDTKRQLKKRARLAMAMFQPQASEVKPAAPAVSLGEVFEQAVDSGSQRRIELRIPSTVTEGAGAHSQTDVIHQPSTSSGTIREPVPEPRENEESSGFGLIEPAPKVTEDKEEKEREEEWSETKFISKSELRKGRLSQREMEKISVFRNYKEGEPSRRIYIKNLAKQVTEEDLHWVFGRYVDWDDNGQKAM